MINKTYSRVKKYTLKNRKKILVLLLLFALFSLAANLPYIGIFLSLQNRIIGIWILTLVLLRPKASVNFVVSFIFLLMAMAYLFLGMDIQAENLGVVTFVIFSIGIGFYTKEFFKNGK